MNRYVFVTSKDRNMEVLYAGFMDKGRGYIRLPYPWHEDVRGLEKESKENYYKELILSAVPDCGEQFCFIIYSRLFEWWSVSIAEILKSLYKGCKIICYFGDLIETHECSVEEIRKKCDYVFTFDKGEAQKYKINFCQEPYSGYDAKKEDVISNVCFIGTAKERTKKLILIYEYLTSRGFVCDFHIRGVPVQERKYEEKINYFDECMDYGDIVRRIKQSKCILEVMQKNSVSPTTRFAEALIYNKTLLTDCTDDSISRIPNIVQFKDVSDIDVEKLRQNSNYDNSKWVNYFSIDEMINTIERVVKS